METYGEQKHGAEGQQGETANAAPARDLPCDGRRSTRAVRRVVAVLAFVCWPPQKATTYM